MTTNRTIGIPASLPWDLRVTLLGVDPTVTQSRLEQAKECLAVARAAMDGERSTSVSTTLGGRRGHQVEAAWTGGGVDVLITDRLVRIETEARGPDARSDRRMRLEVVEVEGAPGSMAELVADTGGFMKDQLDRGIALLSLREDRTRRATLEDYDDAARRLMAIVAASPHGDPRRSMEAIGAGILWDAGVHLLAADDDPLCEVALPRLVPAIPRDRLDAWAPARVVALRAEIDGDRVSVSIYRPEAGETWGPRTSDRLLSEDEPEAIGPLSAVERLRLASTLPDPKERRP